MLEFQSFISLTCNKKLTSQFFTLLLLIAWLVNKTEHSIWQNTCISLGKIQINKKMQVNLGQQHLPICPSWNLSSPMSNSSLCFQRLLLIPIQNWMRRHPSSKTTVIFCSFSGFSDVDFSCLWSYSKIHMDLRNKIVPGIRNRHETAAHPVLQEQLFTIWVSDNLVYIRGTILLQFELNN